MVVSAAAEFPLLTMGVLTHRLATGLKARALVMDHLPHYSDLPEIIEQVHCWRSLCRFQSPMPKGN